ncbi:hypothetical protein [Breznakiella homolactica]|uniref:Uncharacterized protein n=1 Tax=Breznakiella homolactica TaxID=2798577 RepID=A0A7T7XPX2_9SPIR|nr:hypothetical protein [Breznakiella homolactica]QQO10317.1 hypothetical protein JFL75_05195 [Breznakiella homolactica]
MSRIVVQSVSSNTNLSKEITWERIRIRKTLDELCHYLEMYIPVSERDKIHKHDRLTVHYFNGAVSATASRNLVTTICVDEVCEKSEANHRSLTVIGRSPARDLVDSTWSDTVQGKADLLTIVKTIGSKFGITVEHIPAGGNTSQPVPSFSWENESPWTRLLTEADNQGFIITSNEQGNIQLINPVGWKVNNKFLLAEGKSLKHIQTIESGFEQFHEYIIKGADYETIAVDEQCPAGRVMTINLTDRSIDEAKLRRRAKTEMQRRRQNKVQVMVTGWGPNNDHTLPYGNTHMEEVLWNPCSIVPLDIPNAGLSGNFLISQVDYYAETALVESTITLLKPEVYT